MPFFFVSPGLYLDHEITVTGGYDLLSAVDATNDSTGRQIAQDVAHALQCNLVLPTHESLKTTLLKTC